MKSYDVILIGGGLAGLQFARSLAGTGASILLVDRKPDLTVGVHTTGIFVRKTFEDFDFPAAALGPPISDVSLYSPRLREIRLRSKKPEFRVGKMDVLYRSMLRECVRDGVETSLGTRYIGTETGSEGVSTVVLEKRGVRFNVEAKVVVGADGAVSRVAKDLQLDENAEWIVGCEELFPSKSREARLHCFLDAELAPGYLAWVADDGEDVHIGVGGYASRFEPRAALKEFKKKVRHVYDCGETRPLETRGGRIPVGGILSNIGNRHGILLGDAAGAVSPLTAGGLDPCMRLSRFAADVVAERLRAGDPSVLFNYSGRQFQSRFVTRIWMRRALAMFTNQRLLELGCRLLNTAVGRPLAAHVFFGRGSFPDIRSSTIPSLSDWNAERP
jgi:flavin-dependent dehydrogenase